METPDAGLEQARQKLAELRQTLLTLHKALLDSERTAYEIAHGIVPSAGAFLQLLINDPWFQWLRPITTLLVQIDETLAAKKPPAVASDIERLILDTRARRKRILEALFGSRPALPRRLSAARPNGRTVAKIAARLSISHTLVRYR